MKKKLPFLTFALLLSAIGLSSCSKDEPNPPDTAKENVAGTKWLGYDKNAGSMTLSFGDDGTYRLSFYYGGYSKGSYNQSGTNISFTETSEWESYYDFSKGAISNSGMTLTIPMYYYDGEYAKDFKFTLIPDYTQTGRAD